VAAAVTDMGTDMDMDMDMATGMGTGATVTDMAAGTATATAMSDERERPLKGERIGLFGKGGSGKSTVSVLLAKTLRGLGYEVAVVDADSTNIGLSSALGVERSPRALIDHFGGMVFSGGEVTCPVDDPTPLSGADLSLAQIPEEFVGRNPEGVFLLVAGKIGHRGPGAGCDGPIAKIARDLRLHGDDEGLVTLLDFKAGFEDSARGVVTGLDWAVVIVDPTVAAVRMAADMTEMVAQIRSGALPATRHLEDPQQVGQANSLYRNSRIKGVLCVLNKVADDETELLLRAGLAERGLHPVGVMHQDPSVATAWLVGRELDLEQLGADARVISEALEAAEIDHARTTAVSL